MHFAILFILIFYVAVGAACGGILGLVVSLVFGHATGLSWFFSIIGAVVGYHEILRDPD